MAHDEARIDVAKAKTTPESVFDTPEAVLAARGITLAEKREILEAWEENAKRLLRAEGEGMDGGEPNQLRAVQKAPDAFERT